MQTFGLHEAANFLRMHPETLREKAKVGLIPGTKAGRRWVFLDQHLADWLAARYSKFAQQAPRLAHKGERVWQYSNAAKRGGSALQAPVDNEYVKLLGLVTEKRP